MKTSDFLNKTEHGKGLHEAIGIRESRFKELTDVVMSIFKEDEDLDCLREAINHLIDKDIELGGANEVFLLGYVLASVRGYLEKEDRGDLMQKVLSKVVPAIADAFGKKVLIGEDADMFMKARDSIVN